MAKKILVVDDNLVLLKFVRNLLEGKGHEIQTAEDGFAALDLLANFVPDIMIVDLIMPKIGGDKLCQIVRKMQGMQNCWIIVLSAAMAEIEFDPTKIGADTCIAKGPFAQMAQHILDAVGKAALPGLTAGQQKIVGIESLYVRQMTKELLSRNRHLRTILESMAEGIVEIFDGRIVYVNAAAIKLFDMPEEQLLTADPAALFSEERRSQVSVLLAAKPNTVRTLGQRTPIDLNNRLVTIKRLPVKGTDKTSIMLINDVTERRQLEMQLHHIQKMEAIGTIASGVAHNFRNTLAGILMNNQLIQLNHPDDPEMAQITGRIETSVKRGAELVEGLTQFSRKQVHKEFHPINLTQVIMEIYGIISKSFDQRIQIRLDIPESLPVRGDVSGLSLALLNLCTNARDAMPGGGTLTLSARVGKTVAEVRVADTGTGMDPETLKNCFDPFFTTKQVGQGTGLGLSTTYGIIQSHGGKIMAASTRGQGSVFTLSIPRASEPQCDAPIDPCDPPAGNGERILVVDDEKEFLEAMPPLLKKLGYRVAIVSNGIEALESVSAWNPDVVLLDRNLPDIDGLDCAERILDLKPNVKIAILSGYEEGGPDDGNREFRSRIHGYLTKPVGIYELGHQLQKMLEGDRP